MAKLKIQTRDALRDKVDKLTAEASEKLDSFERSTAALHRALVKTLMVWMECEREPGFLDELFKVRGIRYRIPPDNSPTFLPFLKLVFSKSKVTQAEQSRLGQWNAALFSLYRDYHDRPKHYRAKADAKLYDHLKKNGGIDGLLHKDDKERTKREDETDIQGQETSVNPFLEPPQAALLKFGGDIVKQYPPSGVVTTTTPFRIGDGNLIALLARREADGTINVIGSTNRQAAIDLVSQGLLKLPLSTLHPELRLLVEVIKTQAYPPEAMPRDLGARQKWITDVYRDQTKFLARSIPGRKETKKGEKLLSAKKLIMTGNDKEVLLSGSRLKASVVTRCLTNLLPLDPGDRICMRGMDLLLIERMLETTEINVVSAIPDDVTGNAIRRIPSYYKHHYAMHLKRPTPQKVRMFPFYDATRDAGLAIGFQATFDFDAWKPDWTFAVQQGWFARLRQQLLDEWFVTLGARNQLKRLNNQAMELTVHANKLEVGFNLSDAGSPPPCEMPINANTKRRPKPFKTFHLSKDIAPVFYNIADLELTGDLEVSGNKNALVLSYTTPSGVFDIAIPSATLDGQKYERVEAGFAELRYG